MRNTIIFRLPNLFTCSTKPLCNRMNREKHWAKAWHCVWFMGFITFFYFIIWVYIRTQFVGHSNCLSSFFLSFGFLKYWLVFIIGITHSLWKRCTIAPNFQGPNWVGGAWYGIFLIREKPALRAGLITQCFEKWKTS